MTRHYIITIDGPAASGKSTAAQGLAAALGIRYFNSGALYRAVAWLARTSGIDLDDTEAVLARLRRVRMEVREVEGEVHVFLDGRDVSRELFTNEISREVHRVADPPTIRREIGRLAHELNAGLSFVTEGRDQGTAVFPEAQVKFYLDARPEVRAERRRLELEARGNRLPRDTVLREILERDERDRTRKVGTLKRAQDAVCVDNSDLSCERTVEKLLEHVRARLKK